MKALDGKKETDMIFGDGVGLPCSRPLLPTRCWFVWRWCVSTLEQRSWRRCMDGLKTGPSRRHRIQPAESRFFGLPCKGNVFQKGVRKWPAWNQKWSPLEGQVMVPFWLLQCGKSVEAFISSRSWFDQQQLRLESWTGETHFCAPAFSYVWGPKKGPFFVILFSPISIALTPSRPAAKPALTCFVLISMVLRHWSSRLAWRPASNFVSSYNFFWFAAISITLRPWGLPWGRPFAPAAA